jgi:hypothetical protein
MAASVKRSQQMCFLNTTPSATATYSLIGDGVTELTFNYSPQTTTEQYINQDSGTTDVTGYQPTAPVSMVAKKGDAVYEFINDIRKSRAILSAAESDIILADAWDVATAGDVTAIPAEKQSVSIQIDNYGGAASSPLSIGYTLNFKGGSTAGTFNATTKTFTATV